MRTKKFLAAILAVVMVEGMSLNAFAAETIKEEAKDVVIQVTYDANEVETPDDSSDDTVVTEDNVNKIYSVEIEWDSLVFNINVEDADDVVWNSSTHSYDISNGSWEKEVAAITVTNHSNAAVKATATFEDGDVTDEITAIISETTDTSGVLESAVGTSKEQAPNAEYELSITSTVPTNIASLAYIAGEVTVTVEKY